jgi:hypothetical protein
LAERRMFAKTIIDSDSFLDMPATTQILYFHLAMRADDDGFINNPKKIQRMIGSNDDDLKLLAVKKFIIPFEIGIVVIKHWRIHNYIQKDRYKPTVYIGERQQLQVKQNGAYKALDTGCVQDVSSLDSQVRLGKVRLGKVSKDTSSPDGSGWENKPYKVGSEMFNHFWTAYPKKRSKGDAVKAWNKLKIDNLLCTLIMNKLDDAKNSHDWTKEGGQYIPYPASWLNAKGWEDEYTQVENVPDAWHEIRKFGREEE